MDTYLDIAAIVLRSQRRPLSPRAILDEAYRTGLVPPNLYGKAQHKTLHARISEDIINRRDRSAFFRTDPGRFFLTELMTDTSLPEEFRRPFPTRRRIRELERGLALAIEVELLSGIATVNELIAPRDIFGLLQYDSYRYYDPRTVNSRLAFLRAFVCVRRGWEILTYRLGRYRDDRDNFMSRRSIGFSTIVRPDECTLFNRSNFGIVESGIRATKLDLDIPSSQAIGDRKFEEATLHHFMWSTQPSGTNDLLALICFRCPPWFEPLKRRLALNDLHWIDIRNKVNRLEDFDPWSSRLLETHYRQNLVPGGECGAHSSAA